jgi:hypothetical protein
MTVVPEIEDIHPITISLAEFSENNKLVSVYVYITLWEKTKTDLKTSLKVHQISHVFIHM